MNKMAFFKKEPDWCANKSYIVRCDCNEIDHQIELSWWPKYKNEEELYIHYHLQSEPFWKRVVGAVKYIFGYKSKYGNFGEIVLNKKDVTRLRKALQEYEEDNK